MNNFLKELLQYFVLKKSFTWTLTLNTFWKRLRKKTKGRVGNKERLRERETEKELREIQYLQLVSIEQIILLQSSECMLLKAIFELPDHPQSVLQSQVLDVLTAHAGPKRSVRLVDQLLNFYCLNFKERRDHCYTLNHHVRFKMFFLTLWKSIF